MQIVASTHARKNMRRMHVSMQRVEQIVTNPEVVYPQGDTGRYVAQAGDLSVVYVTDDEKTIIVTVLKRTQAQWTRRRTP